MTEHNPEVETPDADESVEDFDAFWSATDRKRPAVKIAGETYHLVPSLPLQFELEARAMQRSKSQADVQKMLGLLGFPEDAMDRWAAGGMDLEQFQVLLLFATRKVSGQPMTMAEAAETVAKGNAEQAAAKAQRGSGNPTRTRRRKT